VTVERFGLVTKPKLTKGCWQAAVAISVTASRHTNKHKHQNQTQQG